MIFRRNRRAPTQAEVAEVQRWEIDNLRDFCARMAAVNSDDDLWPSVEQLVLARGPREVVATIEAHPVLLTERADAALSIVESFVAHVAMPFAPGVLADRRAWIERSRDVPPSAG